jgi:hypothetical protein
LKIKKIFWNKKNTILLFFYFIFFCCQPRFYGRIVRTPCWLLRRVVVPTAPNGGDQLAILILTHETWEGCFHLLFPRLNSSSRDILSGYIYLASFLFLLPTRPLQINQCKFSRLLWPENSSLRPPGSRVKRILSDQNK